MIAHLLGRGNSARLVSASLLLALMSCQSVGPRSAVYESGALGDVGKAIVFHSESGPIDTPMALSESLTLGDVVQRTLATDPSIQAALARVRVAEAEADQARLLPNPILSFFLHFPQNGVAAPIEVAINEDLFSILQRSGRIDAADDRLRQSTAEALGVVLDVLLDVQSRFVRLQAIEGRLSALENRATVLANLLDVARARLSKGEGTTLAVTTLETETVELRSEATELRSEREDQRLILVRQMGNPAGRTDWRQASWKPPDAAPVAEQAWIEAALERRPEIQARRWQLAALGDELGLARRSTLAGMAVGADVQWDDGWSQGPSAALPLPIFDFGGPRRAAAEARVVEARHLLLDAQRLAVQEVRRTLAAFAAARALQEDVQVNLMALQQKRRSEAEAAFRNGQSDITAVFLADRDIQTTQIRIAELERRTAEAYLRLVRTVGGPGVVANVESQVRE
ncbi:MAG: TolC family protein [Planctomycetes bacterium]|nr:TolC family protein [Planctomycetota bacterium]MBI3843196.1 TolC family protein [Planctomycetota bacterium]